MQLKNAPLGAKVFVSRYAAPESEDVVIVGKDCGDHNCCIALRKASTNGYYGIMSSTIPCRPAWNRIK